jgi:pyruvate dehydrogenase E2 component (dihydrolipoamide acetyltransferase)
MVLDIDGEPTQEPEKSNEEETEESGETDEVEIEPEEAEDSEVESDEPVQSSSTKSGEVLALPKVRKLAEEKNIDLASIKTGERITEEEVLEAADSSETGTPDREENSEQSENLSEEEASEVLATPSVRKLAREKDISIQNIEGSGKGGKVTREDIIQATGESNDTEQKESEHLSEIEGDEKEIEMSQIRKTIADRMQKSRFTAPHVTHFDTADITELVDLREEKKDKTDTHLTYLPFIMKAVHLAMKKHPRINSELDSSEESVILKDHYDFNIAVDTEDGLMVPLIDNIDEKNIVDLAKEVNEKAEKARKGELSQNEMRNGTFSITNLGVIGGEEFTPIINYPQTAILGIGKIQETAEVVDGEIKPRMTVKLSLSYDHRVIDGADAARFTNTVIENLEDPENMILEL